MIIQQFLSFSSIKNTTLFALTIIKFSRLARLSIKQGYERIRKNPNAGGESPDHNSSPNYRREDAILFNLFLPHPLKKLSDAEKLLGFTILEKLIRPYGVIRYPLGMKEQTVERLPDLTGSSSFGGRFKQFISSTEAQSSLIQNSR